MSQLTNVKKTFENLRNGLKTIVGDGIVLGYKEMEPVYQKRIFTNGQTTSGSRIGKYSKKPAYYSLTLKSKLKGRVSTGGLKPLGKAGSDKFSNGKKHKSMYIGTGYHGFRAAVGRQNNTVDLNLTGALSKSIQVGKKGGRTVYGFTNDEKAELAENLEKKYKGKKIFLTSRNEETIAVKTATDYITKRIDNILK